MLIEKASVLSSFPSSSCNSRVAGARRLACDDGTEIATVAAVLPTVTGIAAQTVPSAYS